VSRKRAEIPSYSEQDESRYFTMQSAKREQKFLQKMSKMRAGISPLHLSEREQQFLETMSRMRAGISMQRAGIEKRFLYTVSRM
jgi:hypothetical protein